jgi:hypothetical protein
MAYLNQVGSRAPAEDFVRYLERQRSFSNSSHTLYGERAGYAARYANTGRLVGEWRDLFTEQAINDEVYYIVFSHGHPIAWRTRQGQWLVPEINPERAMGTHQKKIKAALTLLRTRQAA